MTIDYDLGYQSGLKDAAALADALVEHHGRSAAAIIQALEAHYDTTTAQSGIAELSRCVTAFILAESIRGKLQKTATH